MKFIDSVFEKLVRHPKRIVFPEGAEPRVLHAATRFAKLKLGAPVLLGQKDVIERAALKEGVDLGHVGIIDPAHASDLDVFCGHVEKLKRYRLLGNLPAHDIVMNPNYFGALMIQYGQADGLVGGVSVYSGTLLRPLIQLVKPLPNIKSISSCMLLELRNKEFGEKGVFLFADCGVIPEPSIAQLADIAIESGKVFAQLTGTRPRIAMLSFSTKGSARNFPPRKKSPPPPHSRGREPRPGRLTWRSTANSRRTPRCCRSWPRARRRAVLWPGARTC